MNPLLQFFEKNQENCIHKWMHYFDIYDSLFSRFRGKPVSILEIGVFQGGSLNMWRDYFGEDAMIYAIDINPECLQFENDKTKIFIGSQEDREFLQSVKAQIPQVDIVIDDGGHTMSQQIVSFEELYGHIKEGGLYLCEDLHTSYWPHYGGGYKSSASFIEYSKNFIDYINAWHSQNENLVVNEFTRTAYALHYYDSVLAIEKRTIKKPEARMTGKMIIDIDKFPTPETIETNHKEGLFHKVFRHLKLKG